MTEKRMTPKGSHDKDWENEIREATNGRMMGTVGDRMKRAEVVPASSASQERVFNTLRRVLDPQHRHMNADLVEAKTIGQRLANAHNDELNAERVQAGKRPLGSSRGARQPGGLPAKRVQKH